MFVTSLNGRRPHSPVYMLLVQIETLLFTEFVLLSPVISLLLRLCIRRTFVLVLSQFSHLPDYLVSNHLGFSLVDFKFL